MAESENASAGSRATGEPPSPVTLTTTSAADSPVRAGPGSPRCVSPTAETLSPPPPFAVNIDVPSRREW